MLMWQLSFCICCIFLHPCTVCVQLHLNMTVCVSVWKRVYYLQLLVCVRVFTGVCTVFHPFQSLITVWCVLSVCRFPSSRTWCSVWREPTGFLTMGCGSEAANTTTAAPSCIPGQSKAQHIIVLFMFVCRQVFVIHQRIMMSLDQKRWGWYHREAPVTVSLK